LSHAFYVLVEATGGHEEGDKTHFESALEESLEERLVADAVIAQSKQQRADLWAIRDDVEAMIQKLFPPIGFDISLSIPRMDEYVEEVRASLKKRWPASRMVVFGHLGDGNIHLVLTVGSMDESDVREVEKIVYKTLAQHQGVISAEHGIGLEKREYLGHSRSDAEIALMKTLKNTLDPKGILNPGKIIEMTQEGPR